MPPRFKDYRGLTKADREWLERFEYNEAGKFFCDGRDVFPVSLERKGDPVKQATFRQAHSFRRDAMRRVSLFESYEGGSFSSDDDMIEFIDFARTYAREYQAAIRLWAEQCCIELGEAIPSPASTLITAPEEKFEEVEEGRSATPQANPHRFPERRS